MSKPKFKCSLCKCVFFTREDLEYHKFTHFRLTRSGNGEIAPLKLFPELQPFLEYGKILKLGKWNYTLLRDRKTIFRWRD